MNRPLDQMHATLKAIDFDKPADSVWETGFYDVGNGFSVQGIVSPPTEIDGRARIEWLPHKPTAKERALLDDAKVREAFRCIDTSAVMYYAIAYKKFAVAMEIGK